MRTREGRRQVGSPLAQSTSRVATRQQQEQEQQRQQAHRHVGARAEGLPCRLGPRPATAAPPQARAPRCGLPQRRCRRFQGVCHGCTHLVGAALLMRGRLQLIIVDGAKPAGGQGGQGRQDGQGELPALALMLAGRL